MASLDVNSSLTNILLGETIVVYVDSFCNDNGNTPKRL